VSHAFKVVEELHMVQWTMKKMMAVASLTVGLTLASCGDDKDSPESVDIEELKFAGGLRISDLGGGKAQLKWRAMNNEDDFSGYNIYGGKDSGGNLEANEGKTVQLLTDKGDAVEEGRKYLANMSYNGTDWETAGTAESDKTEEIKFLPYYAGKNKKDKPLVPSCRPVSGVCVPLTADTEDDESAKANGEVTFEVSGLKAGSTYCFTVLSTLDEGEKVAQTTSEIRCITPRTTVTGETYAEVGSDQGGTGTTIDRNISVDLEEIRKSCADGTCKTVAATSAVVGSFCNKDTTKAFCIEFNGAGDLLITAGKNTGIQDLGYYASGLSSTDLPPAPKLSSFTELQNKDGYSVSGQSLPLEKNRVYVIANGIGGTTSFYYHWLYVSDVTASGGGSFGSSTTAATVKYTLRVSNKADERRGNRN
jgi:hypothetical protein